jgi:hypothetical protein
MYQQWDSLNYLFQTKTNVFNIHGTKIESILKRGFHEKIYINRRLFP